MESWETHYTKPIIASSHDFYTLEKNARGFYLSGFTATRDGLEFTHESYYGRAVPPYGSLEEGAANDAVHDYSNQPYADILKDLREEAARTYNDRLAFLGLLELKPEDFCRYSYNDAGEIQHQVHAKISWDKLIVPALIATTDHHIREHGGLRRNSKPTCRPPSNACTICLKLATVRSAWQPPTRAASVRPSKN